MNKPLLIASNISKTYQEGEHQTQVLHQVNFTLRHGESLAIVGSSGSGKSTLLHILGTLDKPTSGDVAFLGQDLLTLSEAEQALLRNSQMGFIYQFHHLLPEFSAEENVAMPAWIAGENKKQALVKARNLLEQVGLGHRLSHYPSQLSGGERQRVAIARALINNPKLVLADEPTGNLDAESGLKVYQLLKQLAKAQGTSFIVVTHDMNLANQFDRRLNMSGGELKESVDV
ncbi:lipoprotein-releasing ABC transporter ATP-binding protein LolD [Paraferrimonas sp. SM1919]|uniref:lipoprotein-releasing ABC transporter ATP-binding protein LolD n=1 Tax=Paraferrimonas sp. SM1919 TaxID=2662263 RepID=UPI0013D57D7B|nr:lipoprotein-releasing ABC transporter ATP-binding protein LolD [Paraferrimonas sp. SM1919]